MQSPGRFDPGAFCPGNMVNSLAISPLSQGHITAFIRCVDQLLERLRRGERLIRLQTRAAEAQTNTFLTAASFNIRPPVTPRQLVGSPQGAPLGVTSPVIWCNPMIAFALLC